MKGDSVISAQEKRSKMESSLRATEASMRFINTVKIRNGGDWVSENSFYASPQSIITDLTRSSVYSYLADKIARHPKTPSVLLDWLYENKDDKIKDIVRKHENFRLEGHIKIHKPDSVPSEISSTEMKMLRSDRLNLIKQRNDIKKRA